MVSSTEERGEFALGWKVLFASVLGVACGASPLPFNVIGFTVEPLIAEFGWTRTQILMPVTIFGIIASLLAPFSALWRINMAYGKWRSIRYLPSGSPLRWLR
ncbi:hypothetical protein [Sphingopyxis sp. BSNA05]|uniref:hypothetical protein n=1 Tax=Sphingopyxis sp. BSNA05 TaxID=1236614 RepID=UPI0020B6C82B|nr:hypothetical protein [Sphingopyxis sp. BSNA05]